VAAIARAGRRSPPGSWFHNPMAGRPAAAKKTLPAIQVDRAGSAMLNSVRCSRRLVCVAEAHSPSSATIIDAGAGPNSSSEVKTKISDTDTVAGWPGILILNRPLTIVSVARITM